MRSIDTQLVLNFKGIEAVTPSYVDELLGLIDDSILEAAHEGEPEVDIVFTYPPTRLSSKFSSVGRGRGYKISQLGEDSWLMKKSA